MIKGHNTIMESHKNEKEINGCRKQQVPYTDSESGIKKQAQLLHSTLD